jgi:hypothetical protein
MPSGPPPLLEGQTARVRTAAVPASVAESNAQTDADARKHAPGPTAEVSRKAPAKKAPAKKAAAKKTTRTASKVNAAELGLPTDAGDIANYMASAYTGVGPKSVQSLIEKFGAARVFEALESKPDAVRDVMGAARGDRLLQAWSKDVAARRAGTTSTAAPPALATGRGAKAEKDAGAAKSRTRRGGRQGRGQPAGK